MDPTAILPYSLIALLVIEVLLAGMGVGWYYRFGIPVFHRTFSVSHFPDMPAKALSEAYENEFKDSIAFVTISVDLLGYHEWGPLKVFRLQRGRSFPVFHGLIRFDRMKNQICVTSYLNWFSLVSLGAMFWSIGDWHAFMHWEDFIFFLFMAVFFFWFPYLNFSSVCWFLKDNKYR